jgi:DNA polymerase-3 subunit alpha
MEEREKNGIFKDIFDFARRIDAKSLNKKLMESLIQGGAFDSIHKNRAELFENIETLSAFNAQQEKLKHSNQLSLFGSDAGTMPLPKFKKSMGWSEKEKADREYKSVGFYLTSHPLEQYHYFLERRGIMNSYDLSFLKTAGQIRIVGIIHAITAKISKTGKKYAFVSLSDSHGNFEIMLFSENLEKYKKNLEPGKIVVINAQVKVESKEDSDEEIIRLMTQSIEVFEHFLIDQNNYVQVYVKDSNLENLKFLLKQEDGVKVYLKFIIPVKSKHITITPSSGVELSAKALMKLEQLPGIEVRWL